VQTTKRMSDVAGLGQILVEQGVVTADQLQQAEQHLQQQGGSLAKTLVDLRLATESDLVRALAATLGMPFLEVDGPAWTPAPRRCCRASRPELTALPVGFAEGDKLLVAVADPNQREAVAARLARRPASTSSSASPRGATCCRPSSTTPPPTCGGPPPADRGVPACRPPHRRPPTCRPCPPSPPAPPHESPAGNGLTATAVAGPPGPGAHGAAEEDAAIDLDELLQTLIKRGGSDLHLTAGIPPAIRVTASSSTSTTSPSSSPTSCRRCCTPS
jgi:twitching motility protein PilT